MNRKRKDTASNLRNISIIYSNYLPITSFVRILKLYSKISLINQELSLYWILFECTEQNGFPSVSNLLFAILSMFRGYGPQNLRYILISLKIDKVDLQEKIITLTTKGLFIEL